MTGGILITQSAGDSFVIKTHHAGNVPHNVITVTAEAKGYEEKQFEELDEQIANNLAHPKTKSEEKKKLKERMESLLHRMLKARSNVGGSGQFWFLAVFCKEDDKQSMTYINVGGGLEDGKVFVSLDTGCTVTKFKSMKMMKALAASEVTFVETPTKKKSKVKASTPQLIVAKKQKLMTNNNMHENNETENIEMEPNEVESVDEDDIVVLKTPDKKKAKVPPKPTRRKLDLELFVPKPNQLLPLEVMNHPTKVGGRGRGRPRKAGTGSQNSSGIKRGRPRKSDKVPVINNSSLGQEIQKNTPRRDPKSRIPGCGQGTSKGGGFMDEIDMEVENMNPMVRKSGRIKPSSVKNDKETQSGGGGKCDRKMKRGSHVKSIFMEEIKKAEDEIDSSEDENIQQDESTKAKRKSKKNLSELAITELL